MIATKQEIDKMLDLCIANEVNPERIHKHETYVYNTGKYKNLSVRVRWDIIWHMRSVSKEFRNISQNILDRSKTDQGLDTAMKRVIEKIQKKA